MADREDDQIPEAGRGTCAECGSTLAPDQRYCLNCGARRGRLPGAVAGTVAALSSKGKAAAAGATGKAVKGAALEDLERAPGISKAMARSIYDFFHPSG